MAALMAAMKAVERAEKKAAKTAMMMVAPKAVEKVEKKAVKTARMTADK